MKPCAFELHRVATVDAILDLLAQHGDEARILAGGQSLVPLLNLRMVTPAHLIDVNRVEALAGIRETDDTLEIGAMTRQKHLLTHPLVARHAPMLPKAIRCVGHVQTRSRGTVGGSLAHADPAAELPLAMLALGATFVLRSASGSREVAAGDFFKGALETVLEPGELLFAIRVPKSPPGTRVAFVEFSRRHGDFAIAAAAAQLAPGGGVLVTAVGGVTPTPQVVDAFDDFVGSFDRSGVATRAADALASLEPLSDAYIGPDYRRQLDVVALTDSLEQVLVK